MTQERSGSESNSEKLTFLQWHLEKKCSNCFYFSDAGNTCHRYPPQQTYNHDDKMIEENFPFVDEDDFCGEFKIVREID
jgi:hypothetical protein